MDELVYLIQTPPFWTKTAPLSLAYLRSYLKQNKIEVKILDLNLMLYKYLKAKPKQWLVLNREFENQLFELIEKKYPSILETVYKKIANSNYIGFSIFKRNAPFAFSLAERIEEKFPDKRIIFGGPQAFFLENSKKLNSKDYWVVGEGEIPLYRIIQERKEKIYRFQELANLDSLPFYDFDSLDIANYSSALGLFSSRGCPHQCCFCSERLLYKKFRHHSPDYLIGQISYLKNKYKIRNFVFLDSLINYSRRWLKDFCRKLLTNNLGINWEAQMRIEQKFPLDLAKLMRKSGCYNLFLGLESGSDKVLAAMNKGFTAAEALRFFKTLIQAGLHFEVSLIFSYPRETENEFKETLNFIVKNKNLIPKIAQVNPFVDYLNNFPEDKLSGQEAKKRIETFLKNIQKPRIKYTKSFINNLLYQDYEHQTNKNPKSTLADSDSHC